MIIIGIDPDCEKSAVAIISTADGLLHILKLSYFELFELMPAQKPDLVRIEAGWLNEKSNFHHRYGQTKSAGERIAKNVGANHETGRKTAEMCAYLKLRYELVRPIGTKWIDHRMFVRMTRYKGRTNQDTRDAAMLIAEYFKK